MKFLVNEFETKISKLFNKESIVKKAELSLSEKPQHITDAAAPLSAGGIHDFYSNGDYWWPNPNTADGMPYIQRDGESNPNAFFKHRQILRALKVSVSNLAAGYLVSGNEKYAEKAAQLLKGFFLEEATKMNPHLLFAQAIPGICTGRGIGIIDTLHLIDVTASIDIFTESPFFTQETFKGLKKWFADYLKWMKTHPYGIAEMNAHNNHGVCWHVQAAVFAKFTENHEMQAYCREHFKKVLLPNQMASDGSFPKELARTKPYGYSIFTLDNIVTLCHVLSKPEDNLWTFQLPDGRSVRKAMEFLYPYLVEKAKWPFARDVEHFEAWPVATSSLLFVGFGLIDEKYIELWKCLDPDPKDEEVIRNLAIRQPILWLS